MGMPVDTAVLGVSTVPGNPEILQILLEKFFGLS